MPKFNFEKNSIWIGLVIVFITSFLFTLTSWWPFAILAGLLGGFCSSKIGKSILMGGIGVLLGWGISILIKSLTQFTHILLDQIASILFGTVGLGPVIILGILLIGGVMGILGGIIGNTLRIWILPLSEKEG